MRVLALLLLLLSAFPNVNNADGSTSSWHFNGNETPTAHFFVLNSFFPSTEFTIETWVKTKDITSGDWWMSYAIGNSWQDSFYCELCGFADESASSPRASHASCCMVPGASYLDVSLDMSTAFWGTVDIAVLPNDELHALFCISPAVTCFQSQSFAAALKCPQESYSEPMKQDLPGTPFSGPFCDGDGRCSSDSTSLPLRPLCFHHASSYVASFEPYLFAWLIWCFDVALRIYLFVCFSENMGKRKMRWLKRFVMCPRKAYWLSFFLSLPCIPASALPMQTRIITTSFSAFTKSQEAKNTVPTDGGYPSPSEATLPSLPSLLLTSSVSSLRRELLLSQARAEQLEQEFNSISNELSQKSDELAQETEEHEHERRQRKATEQLLLQFKTFAGLSFSDEEKDKAGDVVDDNRWLPIQKVRDNHKDSRGHANDVNRVMDSALFPPLTVLGMHGTTSSSSSKPKEGQEQHSVGNFVGRSHTLVGRGMATGVSSATALTNALADNVEIEFTADINTYNGISITGITGLVIDGKGYKLDCKGISRCIGIDLGGVPAGAESEVTLIDLTITNGKPSIGTNGGRGGGVYVYDGALTMVYCTIDSNIATSLGGGVAILSGTLTMTFCTIKRNTIENLASITNGGGIAIIGGSATVTMTSCTIADNTSEQGGGVYIIDHAGGATMTMTNCTVSTNTATTYGGGLFISDGTLTMSLCAIESNIASSGGGVYLGRSGTLQLVGCIFSGNSADSTADGRDILQGTPPGTLEFYSLCPGDTAYDGTGTLDCAGDHCAGPADLSDTSSCTACTAPTPFACCGATECLASSRSCTTLEAEICPPATMSPTLQPTLTYMPTLLPTSVPTLYCGAGSRLNDDGTCSLCPVGKYSNTTQAPFSVKCRVCVAGKFANQQGMAECRSCATGKLASADRSFCQDCSAGKYVKAFTKCFACEIGRFAPQPLTGACLACRAGSFTNNDTAATTCSPCNSGEFSTSLTAVKCPLCAAGRASASGQSSCTPCEPGKFANFQGSSSCSECPRGYSSTVGSPSCGEQADTNYFLFLGVEATACPQHAECIGSTVMPQPSAGHWVDRRDLKYANDIYTCPRETCYMRESQRTLLNQRRLDDGSCWDMAAYRDGSNDDNHVDNLCNSDLLLCKKGSRGALCGSCESTFIYSSTDKFCIACDNSQRRGVLLITFLGVVVLVVAGSFFSGIMHKLPEVALFIRKSKVVNFFRGIDTGSLMVAWANYQIVQSVSWSLDVSFPSPFKDMLSLLSFFSFDFLNPECNFEESNHFTAVYLWTLAPIAFAFILIVINSIRMWMPGSTTTMADLTHNLLVLGYLVVPSVSLKQLQAIDCVEVAGKSYVRTDTSVDCDSHEFKVFLFIDILFITVYLSTPMIWLALLLVRRESLNPAPTTGRDKRTSHFLRDQDRTLDPLTFLFRVYRPPCYLFEVVEMYRRILLVGLLPLLAASTDRRAVLGMLFALMSIALYNETRPFRNASTNTLAITAQYACLLTYGVALAIETEIVDGMPPFAIGVFLTVINTAILCLFLYNEKVRRSKERLNDSDKMKRRAYFLEWAVERSKADFDSILNNLEERFLPPTHALVFWYSTSSEANAAILSGIPAKPWIKIPNNCRKTGSSLGAVVFTLHRPYELDKLDLSAFANREAMLACAVPWNLLQPFGNAREVVSDGTHFPSALCVLPVEILEALRGSCFDSLLDPEPWFRGSILMPPHQIVRAYRLSEERTHRETEKVGFRERRRKLDKLPLQNEGADSQTPSSIRDSSSDSNNFEDSFVSRPPLHTRAREAFADEKSSSSTDLLPLHISSCLEFTHHVNRLRTACQEIGMELIYHYTHPNHLPLISSMGFRMSDQGHGVGGVYFSTLGPATYELGTDIYEENIILDCFGVELLDEYKGKGMLDLCLVYGAEPAVLIRAGGDRGNAKMVTKSMFQDFALPDKDGDYFLRPDRILGAFIIPASQRMARSVEAERALTLERAADMASNQRVRDVRHTMITSGDELRSLYQRLHRQKRLGAHGKVSASNATDCNAEIDGDDTGGIV